MVVVFIPEKEDDDRDVTIHHFIRAHLLSRAANVQLTRTSSHNQVAKLSFAHLFSITSVGSTNLVRNLPKHMTS